jgi:hypothetical protein
LRLFADPRCTLGFSGLFLRNERFQVVSLDLQLLDEGKISNSVQLCTTLSVFSSSLLYNASLLASFFLKKYQNKIQSKRKRLNASIWIQEQLSYT